jgi:glycosyltransferase involved in cell wall biosynthesis
MAKTGPIRIGVMLRAIDEKGGIGVYAANIVEELLHRDRHNEYVLYYRNEANLGRYADHANVTERHVDAPNKAFWDQLAMPIAAMNDHIDVLFHPKFTVPFLARCKTVMVVHGADWFMPDQAVFYHPWDVRYIRTVMPLYFKKASLVLSVSQLTTDNFESVLDLPEGKIQTVYFGPAKHFGPVRDPRTLAEVRARYGLPERFIFTLTKLGDRNRKNFGGLAEGYRLYHEAAEDPLPLVVGGKDCHRLVDEYGLPRDGWGSDLLFPGWIDQEDLPAIYSSAELFLYASNLEAFPIPITEAMACGTPIVTSDVNGLEEIAGDAALRVDPKSPGAIAKAVARVIDDAELRRGLSERGLVRSSRFTWERCGEETLRRLEALVRGSDA